MEHAMVIVSPLRRSVEWDMLSITIRKKKIGH